MPEILGQAEVNLSEPSGQLADQAIFHLERFDGVGQGEPYRDDPPAGTIGWYVDLCSRVRDTQPADADLCLAALASVRAYRDWLAAERPGMRLPRRLKRTVLRCISTRTKRRWLSISRRHTTSLDTPERP